jgi:hypothetical protein
MTPDMDFTRQIEELDRRTERQARLWFEEKRKVSAPAAVRGMVSAFWRVYVSQNARRDGVRGLFRAVQEGMFHFVSYAKHWELERNEKNRA